LRLRRDSDVNYSFLSLYHVYVMFMCEELGKCHSYEFCGVLHWKFTSNFLETKIALLSGFRRCGVSYVDNPTRRPDWTDKQIGRQTDRQTVRGRQHRRLRCLPNFQTGGNLLCYGWTVMWTVRDKPLMRNAMLSMSRVD